MIKLKICGLRDATNALVAADAGADFLGFVFVPGARRQLTLEWARAVIKEYRREWRKSEPQLVGLFADQSMDDVNHTIEWCGLDLAQLCGDESHEYWRSVVVPVIKHVRVPDQERRDQSIADIRRRLEEIACHGHMATLDRYEVGSKGGTGHTFDWSIAAAVAKEREFLLAGGLTSENVAEAIEMVCPWGVDVSSGVETNGQKDARKIEAFAAEVTRAGLYISEPDGS